MVSSGYSAGLDGSAAAVKRKRKKTDAYVHIGTTEEYAGGMSDKDRRELECEKVHTLTDWLEPAVCTVCVGPWDGQCGRQEGAAVIGSGRASVQRACYPA
jgi:hypothetical protein